MREPVSPGWAEETDTYAFFVYMRKKNWELQSAESVVFIGEWNDIHIINL